MGQRIIISESDKNHIKKLYEGLNRKVLKEQLEYLDLVIEDDEDGSEGSVLEINFSLGMASAFAARSKALVNAGRLPCPFCGIPIDPRGHLCPRANGYRR